MIVTFLLFNDLNINHAKKGVKDTNGNRISSYLKFLIFQTFQMRDDII